MVLSPDKTGLVLMITGLSPEAIAEDTIAAQKAACQSLPVIKLPNGKELFSSGNGALGYDVDNNYQKMYFYPPITKDVNGATFVMPCIQGTIFGKAPEHWELPLKFVAAGPDVTTIPVEMVTATSRIEASPSVPEKPMKLEKVIQTNDGYIFIGAFQPFSLNSSIAEDSHYYVPTIIDATGQPVSYSIPSDVLQNDDRGGAFYWAYQIQTKDVNWPVTIQFDTVGSDCSTEPVAFELDTGSNPGNEKIWDINKDYKIGACSFKIISAKRTQAGYTFQVTGLGGEIRNLNIDIENYPAPKVSSRDFSSHKEYSLIYDREVPKGRIKVIISGVTLNISGPWHVTWQPGDEQLPKDKPVK